MMLSENEYNYLITKDTPLTIEEAKKVNEFESMILLAKKYSEYGNSEIAQILNNQEIRIGYLESLPDNEKNDNIKKAITSFHKSYDKIEKEREAIAKEENKALTLERKLNDGISRRAGYTNASILIFFVFLIGIIISVVLLTLR